MDEATYESVEFWSELCEEYSSTTSQAEILRVKGNARTFRQLEALVKALDSLETIGSYVVISAEYVPPCFYSKTEYVDADYIS